MNIDALRVFNSLYKLGITEEDFTLVEAEQQAVNHTGLAICLAKRGKVIGVSHDEGHIIIIKEVKHKEVRPKSRVMFKTLTTLWDLPQEVYTLHSIAQYRALDTEIKFVANTIDELKDRICDRFADEYPKALGESKDILYCHRDLEALNRAERDKVELVNKQLRAVFWLFGVQDDFENVKCARLNVPRIIKVFERNNRRVALIQDNQEYKQERGGCFGKWVEQVKKTNLKLKTFFPNDDRYNYVDENREVFITHSVEVWVSDELFEKIESSELKILAERERAEAWMLLTPDAYNSKQSLIRLEVMSARRQEQDETARNQLVKSIAKQFEKGKVIRQGIEFTKKSVTCNGIRFEGSKVGEYLVDREALYLEEPNFNNLFEGYVDFVLKIRVGYSYNHSNPVPFIEFTGCHYFKVGAITICLEKKGNLLRINNRRINNSDVAIVIKKALSFSTQGEYDAYVDFTSRVNMTLQKALHEGALKFELDVDRTADNCLVKDYRTKMVLALPMRREANKVFVTIGSKDYKVSDINALFSIGNKVDDGRLRDGGYLQRTIKLLYRALDGITPKEIGLLIKNGKKEYEEMVRRIEEENALKVKKSKEFVRNAVKLTNAKRTDKGWMVKGLSGTTYYVSDDLKVWTIKDGEQDKYVCIVDTDYESDDNAEWKMNDRVAKRLLALSKDKVVAQEIDTLPLDKEQEAIIV